MLTATPADGIAAVLTAPFTWLVLALLLGAPLVCAWLDRRPPRDPFALSDDVQAARDELRAAAAKGRQMRRRP